jgi:hypothetical protein
LVKKGVGFIVALLLLIASPAAFADSVLGLSGGWQTWSTASLSTQNGIPYWNHDSWDGPGMNIGFCMAGTGNCTTQLSPAPGALPYWGASGGAAVPSFYFLTSNPGGSQAALKVEIAGYANINILGWFAYDPTTGKIVGTPQIIFAGPASAGATATFVPTQYYGFFLQVGTNGPIYYTVSGLNVSDTNRQHFVVFQGANQNFWIGAEDLPSSHTDFDYNDMVVRISPVPEPGTLVLLGTGLIGIAGLVRRKAKS